MRACVRLRVWRVCVWGGGWGGGACIIIIIICVWLGSVIDRVRGEWGSVHKSIQVPACWEWENINRLHTGTASILCVNINIIIFNIHVYKPEWCLTLPRCFITVLLSSCRVYSSTIFRRPCLNVKGHRKAVSGYKIAPNRFKTTYRSVLTFKEKKKKQSITHLSESFSGLRLGCNAFILAKRSEKTVNWTFQNPCHLECQIPRELF